MKRLLIVADDLDHRLIIRTMFEGEGYGCEEAEDGGVAHRFFSRKVSL
jgi:CheY-like chemotaxis protein